MGSRFGASCRVQGLGFRGVGLRGFRIQASGIQVEV